VGAGTRAWTAIDTCAREEGRAWHNPCQSNEWKPTISLMKGGFPMPEFMVAIDHITYYAVQAEDEITAIDLVLDGQGLEISSETRDASISDYTSCDPRRHA
jgi:hypothetical protein